MASGGLAARAWWSAAEREQAAMRGRERKVTATGAATPSFTAAWIGSRRSVCSGALTRDDDACLWLVCFAAPVAALSDQVRCWLLVAGCGAVAAFVRRLKRLKSVRSGHIDDSGCVASNFQLHRLTSNFRPKLSQSQRLPADFPFTATPLPAVPISGGRRSLRDGRRGGHRSLRRDRHGGRSRVHRHRCTTDRTK